MTVQPENYAEPPPSSYDADALSDVLQSIHLRGGRVRRHERGAPRRVPPGVRVMYLIERGTLRVEPDDGEPAELAAGAMGLIARGTGHRILPDADAGWIAGEFDVDAVVADPVLEVLPTLIAVPDHPGSRSWLPVSFAILADEVLARRPGARVMTSRIVDVLFIQALRYWAATAEPSRPGRLTAALDGVVGPVLARVHQSLGDEWPVEEMARRANLSRSAFAARFRAVTGTSPAAYLIEARLDVAAHELGSTRRPVAAIGRSLGYASEAAFSRAFRRRYGRPPRAWRAGETMP